MQRTRLQIVQGLAALALLAGCASHPAPPALPQPSRLQPAIVDDPATGTQYLTFTVMIYNVAGLPWPVRWGTGEAMARLGTAFEQEFTDARPELLLLQEAFVPSATRLAEKAKYRNFVRGPDRGDKPTFDEPQLDPEFLDDRRRFKGEKAEKLVDSGLVIASDFGIAAVVSEPFGKMNCAGFDCMSNKGMMIARIDIPGVPAPLFVLNTHMNAYGAAGVSRERSRYAHNRQIDDMVRFFERDWRGQGPLIYAGDFNTGGAPNRFAYKDARMPGELAHRFCDANRDRCQVKVTWKDEMPWLHTEDLQGYADGGGIKIEPIEISEMFGEPVDGKQLSDHDAVLVKYKLSWCRGASRPE